MGEDYFKNLSRNSSNSKRLLGGSGHGPSTTLEKDGELHKRAYYDKVAEVLDFFKRRNFRHIR